MSWLRNAPVQNQNNFTIYFPQFKLEVICQTEYSNNTLFNIWYKKIYLMSLLSLASDETRLADKHLMIWSANSTEGFIEDFIIYFIAYAKQ